MGTKPTDRQRKYAVAISAALGDNAKLWEMDRCQMAQYISKSLESEENRRKVYEHTGRKMQHRYAIENTRPWLTDESLGGEWGLDASDFGAQAYGDS